MDAKFHTLNRCYFDDVQDANDEDLQKFFLMYRFKITSHPSEMAHKVI